MSCVLRARGSSFSAGQDGDGHRCDYVGGDCSQNTNVNGDENAGIPDWYRSEVSNGEKDQEASAQQQMDKVAMKAETAAIKRTRDSIKNGHPSEYGGLILENKGKFTYTEPMKGTEENFDPDKVPVPKGYQVVGDYHTHPHTTAAEGQGPAPGDIYWLRTPERASRIDYVADSYSGAVYRYTQREPVKGPYDTAVYGTKIGVVP